LPIQLREEFSGERRPPQSTHNGRKCHRLQNMKKFFSQASIIVTPTLTYFKSPEQGNKPGYRVINT